MRCWQELHFASKPSRFLGLPPHRLKVCLQGTHHRAPNHTGPSASDHTNSEFNYCKGIQKDPSKRWEAV